MTGSILDMFPPELQTAFAAAAALSAVAGLFYWAAGIRVARMSAALFLGFAGAGLAAWGLPGVTGISILPAAIVGLVAGMLAGAVTFRFLQGILFAACVALLAGGAYYRVQGVHGAPLAAGPALPAAHVPATLRADQMLIPQDRLSPDAGASRWDDAGKLDAGEVVAAGRKVADQVGRDLADRWTAIPAMHRQRMLVLAIVSGGLALLLSLLFPRQITWIITAALGTALLVTAGYGLLSIYGPQYVVMIPTDVKIRWGIVAIIMLVGMLMQRLLFWPQRKKATANPGVAAAGTALEAPKAF